MTGLERMVEWLEKTGYEDAALREARRLQEEERAQKHTAPASLVEELQDALDHDNGRTLWRCRLIEILSRYRPEHMDEGLREEMRKMADMGSCVGFKDLSIRGVIRELLSRHPAPKDRCAELVEVIKRCKEYLAGTPAAEMCEKAIKLYQGELK